MTAPNAPDQSMQGLRYSLDGSACSDRVFYAVACNPKRPAVVEACAGAGKTWMLVGRIARALLDGTPAHEILAITFTKKAAAEMAQRLSELLAAWQTMTDEALTQALMERGLSASEAASAERLSAARTLHAQAFLGRGVQLRTFHGWFASLLRMAPLSLLQTLGLPSPYELLEDDSEAVAMVWSRFYGALKHEPALLADFTDALKISGRHNVTEALSFALTKRVEFSLADAHAAVTGSDLTMAVANYSAVFPAFSDCANLDAALDEVPPLREALRAAAVAIGQLTKNKTSQRVALALGTAVDDANLLAAKDLLLTKDGSPRVKGVASVDPDAVALAQAWLVDWLGAIHQRACQAHQGRMVRLSRLLLTCFQALKQQRGWVDMNDIESAATTLLADSDISAWVQQRLDAQITHLLIDEFQDTNPMQWRALRSWLEGYAGAGGGSMPSVFIVGDPKQSIYRFRRAEPRVFRAASAFLQDAMGAAVLACDHTRRNAPEIVAALNAAMVATPSNDPDAPVFRTHSTGRTAPGRVICLPLVDTQPGGNSEKRAPASSDQENGSDDNDTNDTNDNDTNDGHNAGDTWRDSLLTRKVHVEEKRAVREVHQAVDWIVDHLRGTSDRASDPPVLTSDIMVIARTNARLGLMQRELAARGIACAQPEKSTLIESPVVADMVALLDGLVSPSADLAIAQALRSPLFGASDEDLTWLARCVAHYRPRGAGRWFLTMRHIASTQNADRPSDGGEAPWQTDRHRAETVRAWVTDFQAMQRLLRTRSVHEALVAIFRSKSVLRRFSEAVPASMVAATKAQLQAFLDEALMVNQGRFMTPYQFVRAIKGGARKQAWPSPQHAVRLLTVHGAKGLEAPIVLLLDTHAAPKKAATMSVLVDWPATEMAPQRFVFVAQESRPPVCAKNLLLTDQQARTTEENNALYVAMTRAESQLVLSAHQPRGNPQASWYSRLSPYAAHLPMGSVLTDNADEAAPQDEVPKTVHIKSVPAWQALKVDNAAPAQAPEADDLSARVGQAMHELLQWRRADDSVVFWTAERVLAVRARWRLDAVQLAQAQQFAQAIVDGEAAWAWDPSQVAFEANEVSLFDGGELLRLDRLLQSRADGAWWVFDYKSNRQPDRDPILCAQLRRYQTFVQRMVNGQTVHAAFLTPDGRLISLPE